MGISKHAGKPVKLLPELWARGRTPGFWFHVGGCWRSKSRAWKSVSVGPCEVRCPQCVPEIATWREDGWARHGGLSGVGIGRGGRKYRCEVVTAIAVTVAFDTEQLLCRKLKIFFTLIFWNIFGVFWNILYIKQFKNQNLIKFTVKQLAFCYVPFPLRVHLPLLRSDHFS